MKNSTPGLVSQILLPKGYISRTARDIRFLILSVLLGLLFCGAFAAVLYFLNKQGRM